jgi:hypothetical protein
LLFFSAAGYSQTTPAANPQEAQQPAANPEQGQQAPEPPHIDPQDMPDPAQAAQQPPQDYGGPAILSRGGAATVTRGSELLRFRPFVSLNGIYDTDLAAASINAAGEVPTSNGYGAEALVGVTGSHQWKRTLLDLDYRGSFRHYSQSTYYDGIDNSLNLNVTHQRSRRLIFEFGQTAARYTRSFFLPNGFTQLSYNPLTTSLTNNDLFDTPTNVLTSTGRVIFQKSARLAFGATGTGFFVRRRSEALAGVTGYGATGDITYRLSRFSTIGVDYNFNHFGFTGQFGASDIHGAALNFATRLTKRWELAFRFGGYRVESLRLQRVQLDPVLVAIFGQQSGIGTFHGVAWAPHAEGRLTRGFRRGSWSVGYSRSVMPGNGVYLTSNYDSAQVGVNYAGWRTVSLQGGGGYTSYSGLTQDLGRYRNYSAGGGASVKLSRYFSMVARLEGRRYDISQSSYKRLAYRATLGVAWSPGDYPLSIW